MQKNLSILSVTEKKIETQTKCLKMGTSQIKPGRFCYGILCSCKRKIKKEEEWRHVLCAVLEIAPKGKTRIISFACICIKKLEGDIKMNKSVVWWVETGRWIQGWMWKSSLCKLFYTLKFLNTIHVLVNE